MFYSKRKGLARGRTQRRMSECVVELIGELAQTRVKVAQSPHGKVLRVDRLGNLSRILHELRVSSEVMNEHGVCGTEKPLTHTAEAGLSRRSSPSTCRGCGLSGSRQVPRRVPYGQCGRSQRDGRRAAAWSGPSASRRACVDKPRVCLHALRSADSASGAWL